MIHLDRKDCQIVEALQEDARQSLSAIGKRIGLSQPAMSERVRKLEEAGVIEGYSARINLQAIGISLRAIIRVRTTHAHIQSYLRLFQEMPEVLEADRVTGEDCFVVRCAIAQPVDLEHVVDTLAAHGSVTTALVLSTPVRKTISTGLACKRSHDNVLPLEGTAPRGSGEASEAISDISDSRAQASVGR